MTSRIFAGPPMSGKTCHAINEALEQSLPVYTNIKDNTSDKSFLPDHFKEIPHLDWTLINEPAFIIYDDCESIPSFCANSKVDDHRVRELRLHRHFGHQIIFIFQHEKFAHKTIRLISNNLTHDPDYKGRRSFRELG